MKTNANFVLRNIYDKAILMPIQHNEISDGPIYLNEVASVIWTLAGASFDKNDLLCHICEIYELQADSMEKIAVKNFIDNLIQMHLIYE